MFSDRYMERLQNANVSDIQQSTAKKLAKEMAEAQEDEQKWRNLSSIIKTAIKVVDPTGGVGSLVADNIIDPIGRNVFDQGASPEDIKLSKNYQIFGGKEALGTTREGLEQSIDDYKSRQLQNSLLSFVGSQAGESIGKWTQDKIFGGKNLKLQKEALKMQNEKGVGKGTQFIADSLEEGAGSEWADSFNSGRTQLSELSKLIKSKIDNLIKSSPEDSWQWGGKARPLMADGKPYTIFDDPLTATNVWSNQLLPEKNTYEQGGIVQKYENGGDVTYNLLGQEVDSGAGGSGQGGQYYQELLAQAQAYKARTGDTEIDRAISDLQSPFENWRKMGAEAATKYLGDRSSYEGSMHGLIEEGGEGIKNFLRNPAMADVVNKAAMEDENALSKLVEALVLQRPELRAKTNEELRTAIKRVLPAAGVDLYGQGYKDVLAEGETTLEGLTGKAQQLRAGVATQKATSGIRTPGSVDTISKGLYKGAEDTYAGMQKGIQSSFDESFGTLENVFLKDFG